MNQLRLYQLHCDGDLATLCYIQHVLAAAGVSVVTAHSRRLALVLVQSHKAFTSLQGLIGIHVGSSTVRKRVRGSGRANYNS
jgi:hypothetical protein